MTHVRVLLISALFVACHDEGSPVTTWVIPLMGQSNMEGRGVSTGSDTTDTIDGVYSYTQAGAIVAASHPLHEGGDADFGLAMDFARYIKDPSADILFVPCAVGGTALSVWEPGGDQYASCVARVSGAVAAVADAEVHAYLWHQGETDATSPTNSASYSDRLLVAIASYRAELGYAPWVVGELAADLESNVNPPYAYADVVDAQLAIVAQTAKNTALVSSEGLATQSVHFTRADLIELGARYGRAYLQAVQGTPAGSRESTMAWNYKTTYQ